MSGYKIKIPKGIVYKELYHFMGGDDETHFNQRPLIARNLIVKLSPGKIIELTAEELKQFKSEVSNALDILQDHIEDKPKEGCWSALSQWHLSNFQNKLDSL